MDRHGTIHDLASTLSSLRFDASHGVCYEHRCLNAVAMLATRSGDPSSGEFALANQLCFVKCRWMRSTDQYRI